MERISKTEYFLEIAKTVSKRSTCLKRNYGCVIVKNGVIISTGYNGSPRGEVNCCDIGNCPRMDVPHNSGDYRGCPSVHAEQNAMLQADREDMYGACLYIACNENINGIEVEVENPEPCPICMSMIKNSGIAYVRNKKGIVWKKEG